MNRGPLFDADIAWPYVPHRRGDEPVPIVPFADEVGFMFPTGVGMNRDLSVNWLNTFMSIMFPTGVGMNRDQAFLPRILWNHYQNVPHRRGDEPKSQTLPLNYSDHMFPTGVGMNRFVRHSEFSDNRLQKMFPTGVGMNRAQIRGLPSTQYVPHRRGDEPSSKTLGESRFTKVKPGLCSPQAWG